MSTQSLQLADDLSDVLGKSPYSDSLKTNRIPLDLVDIALRYQLNLKGLLALEKETKLQTLTTHPKVTRYIFPYLSFDVNVWIYNNGEPTIIDSSSNGEQLIKTLKKERILPVSLLTTHNDTDHIGGHTSLRANYPALSESVPKNCTTFKTPGHVEEQICYYFTEDKICFCGDALFASSMGKARTSYTESLKSLHKILSLPEETLLFPGHGPATTVAREKKFNCFYNPAFDLTKSV